MVTDLTALDIANASLLDEATAAAEAMALCHAVVPNRKTFFVADNCHPQTIAVVQTRAKPLGIEIKIGNYSRFKFDRHDFRRTRAVSRHRWRDLRLREFVRQAHDAGALVVVAADILALTLLKPPGEFGADVAVGNTQRFGVPLGFRRTARGILRHARPIQTPHARPIWWAFHTMPKAVLLIALRCKPASNTSVAIKRRATSARHRFFSPSSHRCTRSIMDHKACAQSPNAFISLTSQLGRCDLRALGLHNRA